MRVLFCGDRHWDNFIIIFNALRHLHHKRRVELLIEGEAEGADKLSRRAAEMLDIPVQPCAANWRELGKAAGPIRNREMLKFNPDLVVAFQEQLEYSKGTANMIRMAKKDGVSVILWDGKRFKTV